MTHALARLIVCVYAQWRYLYISPDHCELRAHAHPLYPRTDTRAPFTVWQSELWYCALSLSSKLFLGLLLYINILMFASFSEGLNDSVPRDGL